MAERRPRRWRLDVANWIVHMDGPIGTRNRRGEPNGPPRWPEGCLLDLGRWMFDVGSSVPIEWSLWTTLLVQAPPGWMKTSAMGELACARVKGIGTAKLKCDPSRLKHDPHGCWGQGSSTSPGLRRRLARALLFRGGLLNEGGASGRAQRVAVNPGVQRRTSDRTGAAGLCRLFQTTPSRTIRDRCRVERLCR